MLCSTTIQRLALWARLARLYGDLLVRKNSSTSGTGTCWPSRSIGPLPISREASGQCNARQLHLRTRRDYKKSMPSAHSGESVFMRQLGKNKMCPDRPTAHAWNLGRRRYGGFLLSMHKMCIDRSVQVKSTCAISVAVQYTRYTS